MTVGCRHVHRPVAGTAHIGLAPLFDALESTLVGPVVMLSLGGADQLAKFIVETFGPEIALLLGDPLLQAKMRLDDEFAHGGSPLKRILDGF